MKKTKIVYWVSTLAIFIFEGVLVAFTSHTELAKEGIRSLGYPDYFGTLLAIFKVVGAVGLILPQVKGNAKEWVYAGFGFDFVFAFLSLLIVGGVSVSLLMPVVFIVFLILSYRSYHKLRRMPAVAPAATAKLAM